MKINAAATVIAIVVGLPGCASKESIVSSTLATTTVGEGVIYSLPKQLVKVSYSRVLLDATKTANNVKTAKEGVEATSKAINDVTAEETNTADLLASVDPNSVEKAATETKLNIELAIIKARKVSLTAKLNEFEDAYEEAKAEHALTLQDPHALSEKLEITAQPVTTEAKETFLAVTRHEGTFSDTLEINTKNGLLNGALGQSDDKTGEIITTLASTLSGLARFPSVSQKPMMWVQPVKDPAACGENLVGSMTQVVDPMSDDMAVLNRALEKMACINITVERSKEVNSLGAIKEFNGLVYRQPGVVNFVVKKSDETVQIIPLTLAQGGHIGVISMPKGRFSKNEYDIAFTNGALAKSRIVQPSEAMGVAMIVPNAIKGIFALPTELIKLKVDYSTNEQSLAEIKKAMIDAQVEIEKKQIELDSLRNTGTSE